MAVSTASAPVFIGSTTSRPHSPASSSQNGPSWSWRKARDVSVTRRACSTSAATMRGWQCPWFTAE
jgi:hypothetical protein